MTPSLKPNPSCRSHRKGWSQRSLVKKGRLSVHCKTALTGTWDRASIGKDLPQRGQTRAVQTLMHLCFHRLGTN